MATPKRSNPRRILLTGATGYIGGRLLSRLETRGERVRCLARRPEFMPRVADTTEVAAGDVLDASSLTTAMRGIDVAYYLVHSMGDLGDFEAREHQAATNFAAAARAAGVRRVVYLGGLGRGEEPGATTPSSGQQLSAHLSSRHRVGRILREQGPPTIELRAAVILGSGSLSFEMLRALSNRLPVMVTPRWVNTPTQPIAVDDILDYLVAALDVEVPAGYPGGSAVFEVGGADVVSYGEMMAEYCRQRGLRRAFLPVPVLTPWLSSLWLALVTPLYARVGRKLIDSIKNATVVEDTSALEVFDIRPRGLSESIARALRNEDEEFARTAWSNALGGETSWAGVEFGTRRVDSRTVRVDCSVEHAFAPIQRIGGFRGWYFGNALWRLRGALDRLIGGVGLRRGRRDAVDLRVGDALDFWRVEEVTPPRSLRLRAEMRLPGRAWLHFEVEPDGNGAIIRQTAIFDPVGLLGLAYWFSLVPFHAVMFRGMVRAIGRDAEDRARAAGRSSAPAESVVGAAPGPIRPVTPKSEARPATRE